MRATTTEAPTDGANFENREECRPDLHPADASILRVEALREDTEKLVRFRHVRRRAPWRRGVARHAEPVVWNTCADGEVLAPPWFAVGRQFWTRRMSTAPTEAVAPARFTPEMCLARTESMPRVELAKGSGSIAVPELPPVRGPRRAREVMPALRSEPAAPRSTRRSRSR